MSMKLVPGKVYLRDTRNQQVYEYEATLAGMSFIQAFTQEETDEDNKDNIELSKGGSPEADTTAKPQDTEKNTTPVREQAQQAANAANKPVAPKPPAAKVVSKVAAKKVAPKPPVK